jgi:anti-sigma regulatory factor (Ser/Thr protein kinase)
MQLETSTRTRDFRHEAWFYAGVAEFLSAAVPFVRDGVEAGEAVMVATSAAKIEALRAELGADADAVTFADLAVLGRNPARIIEAWHEFIAAAAVAGVFTRGIGEPAYAERTAAELDECAQHESLLNEALAGTSCWLACPYDITSLDAAVLDTACVNHPIVVHNAKHHVSDVYLAPTVASFGSPLPPPPDDAYSFEFRLQELRCVRERVVRDARACGFDDNRAIELAIAASEIATNSIVHGGGRGTFVTWHEDRSLHCEFRDRGHIENLLVGRLRPTGGASGGYGVWLANCLCDLVQIRTGEQGTVVRLHARA